ncbi:MAG: DUF333 domain-containing protein [Desulfamplus sp.]|nr:DUF333 domain-containing protein [Desulfamplus sp.]
MLKKSPISFIVKEFQPNNNCSKIAYILIFIVFIFFAACKSTAPTDNDSYNSFAGSGSEKSRNSRNIKIENPASNPIVKPDAMRMANPAATRCIDDGYQLEPVVENGVTVEYMCVNPETGLKCEAWKYLRNECSLK